MMQLLLYYQTMPKKHPMGFDNEMTFCDVFCNIK
jgi:hypothetical protein